MVKPKNQNKKGFTSYSPLYFLSYLELMAETLLGNHVWDDHFYCISIHVKKKLELRFLNQVGGRFPFFSSMKLNDLCSWFCQRSLGINHWDKAYEELLEGLDLVKLPSSKIINVKRFPSIRTESKLMIIKNTDKLKSFPSPFVKSSDQSTNSKNCNRKKPKSFLPHPHFKIASYFYFSRCSLGIGFSPRFL